MKEEKPFIVVFNHEEKAVVTIDKRSVTDNESSEMVEGFRRSGLIVREITLDEYIEIRKNTNFQ
jgi:hypothetical protein